MGARGFIHYGVAIGDDAVIATDAFLMKGEQVAPGTRWSGNPARPAPTRAPTPHAEPPAAATVELPACHPANTFPRRVQSHLDLGTCPDDAPAAGTGTSDTTDGTDDEVLRTRFKRYAPSEHRLPTNAPINAHLILKSEYSLLSWLDYSCLRTSVSSVRLYILGALATLGPMHGHQIRREAQSNRTELWTDIKVGSLYGALNRMAEEGIIEAVRIERSGNMPARTIYAITDTGRQELSVLREEVLREVRLRPDPVDLALQYSAELGPDAVIAAFTNRRAALQAELDAWQLLHAHAKPYLRGTEPLSFEHHTIRLDAEITWHDRVIAELPTALAPPN